MTTLRSLIHRLRRSTHGATAVEYGLIVAGIAITLIASLTTIGTGIDQTFTTVGSTLESGQSN